VVVSDTHNQHHELEIPQADVLLHCGDATHYRSSTNDFQAFNDWLGSVPTRYKVVIAGNHDKYSYQNDPKKTSSLIPNASYYLQDSMCEIDGVKIYGSPWIPSRQFWKRANAFSVSNIEQKFADIPHDLDILMTHVPVANVGLDAPGEGSPELAIEVIERKKPHVCTFGHSHGAKGARKFNLSDSDRDIVFVNAAQACWQRPIVFDYHY